MKRRRILGACAVALLVSGAVASSASAFTEEAPEVGRCLAHAGGRFKDGGCKTPSKPGEEKFEWYPGFGPNAKGEEKLLEPSQLTYTAKSNTGSVIKLETVGGEIVTCKEQTSEGEYTGPKTNRAFNIAFTGCEALASPCTGTNPKAAKRGEILVKELTGFIGFEKVSAKASADKIANVFKPTTSEIFAEFECTGLQIKVIGEVMVPVPTNTMKQSGTVKFTAEKGIQKPEKLATDPAGTKRVLFSENKLKKELLQAGQTLTTTQTNKTKLEASSVN